MIMLNVDEVNTLKGYYLNVIRNKSKDIIDGNKDKLVCELCPLVERLTEIKPDYYLLAVCSVTGKGHLCNGSCFLEMDFNKEQDGFNVIKDKFELKRDLLRQRDKRLLDLDVN